MNFWEFANNHPFWATVMVIFASWAVASFFPRFKIRWTRTPSGGAEEKKS